MSHDTKNVHATTEEFISNLITEAGMNTNLEPDVLAELKKDLGERLENRINAAILSQIPEHKLAEFEKLVDEGDKEKTQAFCADVIPGLNELIAAEFVGFRNRYIS